MYPDIPLPPESVLAKWRTWIHSSFISCGKLECYTIVFKTFDNSDSSALFIAKHILSGNNVQKMLPVIENHFSWLPETLQ